MAVGLWFIGKGISEAVIAHQSVGWQSTRGRITDSKIVASRGRKGGSSYKPQITFEYRVDGAIYTSSNAFFGQGIAGGSYAHRYINKYKQDTEVTVSYNPHRPDQAVLEPGITKRVFAPIVFGLVFFVMGGSFMLLSWILS
jgi:hypothetical protein